MTTTTMIAGFRHRRGVTAIEYGLIAFLIAATIGIAVAFAGQKLNATYCTVAGALVPGSAPGCSGTAPAALNLPPSFSGWTTPTAALKCGSMSMSSMPATTGSVSENLVCTSGGSQYSSNNASMSVSSIGSGYYVDTYNATITGPSGQTASITESYNTYGEQSGFTPTSTPYANPNGAGTCINEQLSKLTSTQRQIAGFSSTSAEGALANGIAQVCSG